MTKKYLIREEWKRKGVSKKKVEENRWPEIDDKDRQCREASSDLLQPLLVLHHKCDAGGNNIAVVAVVAVVRSIHSYRFLQRIQLSVRQIHSQTNSFKHIGFT